MSYVCDTCGKQFSTSFSIQRHGRNVRKIDLYTKPSPLVSGPGTLHHPFTCIVAGSTQSGKTVWVNVWENDRCGRITVWENAQQTIRPPPQRILSGAMDNGNTCT